MDINVRPGNLNDISFIRKLLEKYFDFNISPLRRYSKEEIEKARGELCRDLRKRLEEESLISFIAEEKNTTIPLGFCLLEDIVDPVTGQKAIYLNNIAVEEHAMGKRISSKIVNRMHEYAEDRGIPIIIGDIATSNRRSMLFALRMCSYKPEKVVLLKFLEY